ncbi:metalloregulator ArsR/SmtB family transcription factor [Puniceicoccaceae bacterium K14]|nr:metalloregulator ArsR/SmtB family transcription factor [Puniceicoccaceae bacterium K14]
MKPDWEILKTLSDPTRLRLLSLVEKEELSVAELQEILDMAQSRISSQLSILRQSNLVSDRRDGKKTFYSLNTNIPSQQLQLFKAALKTVEGASELTDDQDNLNRVIARRRKKSEEYFNLIAGRLGKNYCPGRSWESIGHSLLYLVPKIKIADLGAGEGLISQLLAKQAEFVYCVDNSSKMVDVGTELAKKNGLENLQYILGDIEKVPLEDSSVNLVILSQALHHASHPETAIKEAYRILAPGGRVVILDLKEHTFEKARELYADNWLGFAENKLHSWLKNAGFESAEVSTVSKEENAPYFETILASGLKL